MDFVPSIRSRRLGLSQGKRLVAAIVIELMALIPAVSGAPNAAVQPTPSSMPTAAATVLNRLYGFAGGRTISGQHHKLEIDNQPASDWPTHWSDYVAFQTGKRPGLWGGDFLWYDYGKCQTRLELVKQAQRQWADGSLVTLMWHAPMPKLGPTRDACIQGPKGDPYEHLTEDEWNALLTDGSPLNMAWRAQLDDVSGYLRTLRDIGVGVLWRPMHEMNDGWSWWGGHGAQSRMLFEKMHDYMVDVQGLDNLVWVWNVTDKNPAEFADYLPASRYVDVLSLDVWNKGYGEGDEPSHIEYQKLLELAAGRPIALGEVKKVPSPALLKRQPRWSWFMLWPDYLENGSGLNNPATLSQTYGDPGVINRDGMVRQRPPESAKNLAAGRPAYASSSENAKLEPLFAVDGNASTRWSSEYQDSQWFYVDLGAATSVRRIRLDWEVAYARKYQIQISTDGNAWQTVHQQNSGDGGIDDIVLNEPRIARYVKVYAWERATAYGYSLWDFGVYGETASKQRIMIVGDSLSAGPGCYKKYLVQKLNASGYSNYEFVGQYDDQCSGGVRHSGVSCATAEQFTEPTFMMPNCSEGVSFPGMPSLVARHSPDLIMVQLGVNDIWLGHAQESILAAYTQLVQEARTQNPNVVLVFAQIAKMRPDCAVDDSTLMRAESLVNAMPAWAQKMSRPESPVFVADLWTNSDWSLAETIDCVHPNDVGAQRMGLNWFNALQPILSKH